MSEIKLRGGQTPIELAKEFIKAMQENKSGSKDMDVLFESYKLLEKKPNIPSTIIDAVKNVHGSNYDATTLPFLVDNKIGVTLPLLHFVCSQSMGNPEFIKTMLGFYALVYYAEHPKSSMLNFEWVSDQIGGGKIIGWQQFFFWACEAKLPDGTNVFDTLKPEDIFTYQETK